MASRLTPGGNAGEEASKPVRPFALLAPVVLVACVGASPCAPGRTCRAATWQDLTLSDTNRTLSPTDMDPSMGDAISLSPHGVRLRFDLRAFGPSPGIARAVLSLRADARAVTRGHATLRARALLTRWRAGTSDDTPRGDDTVSVSLSAQLRAPVRMDVTALVAAAAQRGATTADLAVACDDDVRIAGPWDLANAPRLEVAAR